MTTLGHKLTCGNYEKGCRLHWLIFQVIPNTNSHGFWARRLVFDFLPERLPVFRLPSSQICQHDSFPHPFVFYTTYFKKECRKIWKKKTKTTTTKKKTSVMIGQYFEKKPKQNKTEMCPLSLYYLFSLVSYVFKCIYKVCKIRVYFY